MVTHDGQEHPAAGSWRQEALSLRASLAWIERALTRHGPETALITIARAKATSDHHRRNRSAEASE
ncbi:MAG: hypothetical protein ACLQFR_00305 [Streptosporangiaceae bacterium]